MRTARQYSKGEDFDVGHVRNDASPQRDDYRHEFITRQIDHYFRVNHWMLVLDKVDERSVFSIASDRINTPQNRREEQLLLRTLDPIWDP